MGGLESLPDAPLVAQMVIAATGESPSDLRIVDRGVTAVAWRADTDGGAYCVLVGLPPQPEGSEYPGAAPQFEARAALLAALRERDPRCPEVFATDRSPSVPASLQRWPWTVTAWLPGAPLEGAEEMTSALAHEVGELLAALHAIPATGHGLLADTAEEVRGASEEPGADFTSRWGRALWPFDGRPLAAHPLVQAAPGLVLQVGALREQLLAYAEQGARAVCHTDLNPRHIWVDEAGHLTGLIDFGDAAVLPPAVDIASFAYSYGWEATEALLEGYAANRVLRDIRRAEAYQLGVLLALQKIEKHTRFRPDAERVRRAVAFLEATLPHAVRRTDASVPHVELPTGIRIRYDECGPREARPLVLAHGFSVSLEMWFPQMHVLSQDYRLITWDARGHGGSSAPDDLASYTMPALAEDLRGLLEALDAVEGAVIGGMSFGGQIGTQYAVDHPDDVHALILSDTTTRGDGPTDPIRSQEFPEWAGDPGMEGCRHAMRTRPDLTNALKDLEVRALVIVGMYDGMILPGLHRLDGLPRRRIVRLDGCGHGTSSQRPRDWAEEVLRFLRDVDAGHELGEDEVR